MDSSGGGAAAEESIPEVGALLVAPDDHFQRVARFHALLAEGAQHFERSQHAERAVVVAAPRHGIEMGPEEDGREGLLSCAPAEEVSGGVGAHRESGAFHLAVIQARAASSSFENASRWAPPSGWGPKRERVMSESRRRPASMPRGSSEGPSVSAGGLGNFPRRSSVMSI